MQTKPWTMVEIKLQLTDNVATLHAITKWRLKCNASIESNSVMPRHPSQATSMMLSRTLPVAAADGSERPPLRRGVTAETKFPIWRFGTGHCDDSAGTMSGFSLVKI